jgi:uncharacterized protein YjiS (DUF1127 family)
MPNSSATGRDCAQIAARADRSVRRWFFLSAWFENRAACRRLRRYASLDPRLAKDIGLTPAELAMLCAGPPWRAVARTSITAVSADRSGVFARLP